MDFFQAPSNGICRKLRKSKRRDWNGIVRSSSPVPQRQIRGEHQGYLEEAEDLDDSVDSVDQTWRSFSNKLECFPASATSIPLPFTDAGSPNSQYG